MEQKYNNEITQIQYSLSQQTTAGTMKTGMQHRWTSLTIQLGLCYDRPYYGTTSRHQGLLPTAVHQKPDCLHTVRFSDRCMGPPGP